MRPSKQLRVLGMAGVVAGGFGACLAFAVWLLLGVAPLRTIGVHGMLPQNFHSLLFSAFAQIVLAEALFVASIGWLCTRGGRLASFAAMAGGAITLLAGVAAPVSFGLLTPWLGLLAALSANAVATTVASYFCALGMVSLLEQRIWPARKWLLLALPPLITGVLFGSVAVANRALQPMTIEAQVERRLVLSAKCSEGDTLETRCGLISAFAHSEAAVVLVAGGDSLALESFESGMPHRRKWKVELPFRGDSFGSLSLAVNAEGTRIAVASTKAALMVDGTSGAFIHPIEPCGSRNHDGRASLALAFTPDGRTVAVGQEALCLRPVDSETGEERLDVGAKGIEALSFDGAGDVVWLIVGGKVEAWNIHDRQRITSLGPKDATHYLALSRDGGRVATLGWGGLSLWDARSGQILGHLDASAVNNGNPLHGSLAFLPDGRHLIVLSSYGYYVAAPATGELSRQMDHARSYKYLGIDNERSFVALASQGAFGESTPTVQFVGLADVLRSLPAGQ